MKLYVSDVAKTTKNLLAIPPILLGSYAASKAIEHPLIIETFDNAIKALSNDITNNTILASLIAGSYFITQDRKQRILGNLCFLGGNVGFLSMALQNNPEPFFMAQTVALIGLTTKALIYEMTNNENKEIKKEETKNSKLMEFLKDKTQAVTNGIKRFGKECVESLHYINKENKNYLSIVGLGVGAYLMSKHQIDLNTILMTLDTLKEKSTQIVGMGLTFYGSYQLSKGEYLKTGVAYLGANMAWMTHPNSDLHQMATVVFSYTSALMIQNAAKNLEENNQLKSINELFNNYFKKSTQKLEKKEEDTSIEGIKR